MILPRARRSAGVPRQSPADVHSGWPRPRGSGYNIICTPNPPTNIVPTNIA